MQEIIEKRKFMREIWREAERSARPDKCFLCGQANIPFCNSHLTPRFILQNISENGEILNFHNFSFHDDVSFDTKYGLNNSGTFRFICRKCDTNAECRTSEMLQIEEHICQAVKDIFSIYSFNQLYLWLAASAVHPYNQQFIWRFETMMACLLSIKPDKFENQKLEHSVFSEILKKTSSELAAFTSMLEDFEPLFQLKKIPLFLGKEKYYFFMGHTNNRILFGIVSQKQYIQYSVNSNIH